MGKPIMEVFVLLYLVMYSALHRIAHLKMRKGGISTLSTCQKTIKLFSRGILLYLSQVSQIYVESRISYFYYFLEWLSGFFRIFHIIICSYPDSDAFVTFQLLSYERLETPKVVLNVNSQTLLKMDHQVSSQSI